MERRRVVIIGAGTAGLTALSQVRKLTDDFLVINRGPYGTTCARIGCMPSKALIEAAGIYHGRLSYPEMGFISRAEPEVDGRAVLARVRRLRDRFVKGVLEATENLGGRNIPGEARILAPDLVEVDGRRITADALVIAPGSTPVVPGPWRSLGESLLTSDGLFEMEDLPESLAVVGLGAIGLEMAQAMARLGVRVEGFDAAPVIGGITDPRVAEAAAEIIGGEFPIHLGVSVDPAPAPRGVSISGSTFQKVLVAVGRKPNVEGLGLENLGVPLDRRGIPETDPNTMQVGNLPVFLAGDANGMSPILHEAADDGFIAGRNAMAGSPDRYCRRAALGIVFTSPNIAFAGKRFGELDPDGVAVGEADFKGQGRAVTAGENRGVLRVYARADTGELLGSEMIAPDGEHLAHLAAWSIQMGLTLGGVLAMPFYHPVVEEAFRGALRNASARMRTRADEIRVCPGTPVE
jgi:dihydrolipoamide dehydrogenase